MTLCCGALAVAVVAAAALLTGCGETKPEDVARSYVATNHASKCDELTQGLVEDLTGERGAAARAACRRNVVRFPAPKDVRVRAVSDEGSGKDEGHGAREEREEAEVQLVADGHPAEVRLVRHGERWLIAGLGD